MCGHTHTGTNEPPKFVMSWEQATDRSEERLKKKWEQRHTVEKNMENLDPGGHDFFLVARVINNHIQGSTV